MLLNHEALGLELKYHYNQTILTSKTITGFDDIYKQTILTSKIITVFGDIVKSIEDFNYEKFAQIIDLNETKFLALANFRFSISVGKEAIKVNLFEYGLLNFLRTGKVSLNHINLINVNNLTKTLLKLVSHNHDYLLKGDLDFIKNYKLALPKNLRNQIITSHFNSLINEVILICHLKTKFQEDTKLISIQQRKLLPVHFHFLVSPDAELTPYLLHFLIKLLDSRNPYFQIFIIDYIRTQSSLITTIIYNLAANNAKQEIIKRGLSNKFNDVFKDEGSPLEIDHVRKKLSLNRDENKINTNFHIVALASMSNLLVNYLRFPLENFQSTEQIRANLSLLLQFYENEMTNSKGLPSCLFVHLQSLSNFNPKEKVHEKLVLDDESDISNSLSNRLSGSANESYSEVSSKWQEFIKKFSEILSSQNATASAGSPITYQFPTVNIQFPKLHGKTMFPEAYF